MDTSDKKNDATVIKPVKKSPPEESASLIDQSNATVIRKPDSSVDTEQARALTKIGKSLRESDNSTGFEKARQAANLALSNQKIIINNRFVLDTIIGGGGMGTVYKARDLRKVEADDANPFVAVKVLNEDFEQHPDAFVTLQREASRSQILAHPNIVQVHDFDRDGSMIYMTMQLLEGTDLEAYIKSNLGTGIPVDEALHIIEEYCSALIYAHDKHIVHSDLKPGNIFLTEAGTKVLDFGIARFSSDMSSQDSFDAGSLGALTPAYASLEMLNGEPPDPRDDVYAAAIIAYELLSGGQHPYQRKSAQEALLAGLKPARIAKLNKRQWRALDAALKLRREERTPSTTQFIQQLTGSRKSLAVKAVALGLVLVTGMMIYFQFLAPDEVKTVVADTLKKGQQCLAAEDYACARDSATAVLKLDAENKAAESLYQASVAAGQKAQISEIHTSALNCIQVGDLDCARAEVMALQRISPDSPLIMDIQTRLQIKEARDNAERCMAEKQYDCVVQNTNIILGLEAGNADALILSEQAKRLQAKQQQSEASNQQQYNKNMTEAQNCFVAGNYACSIKTAKKALQYKPSDVDAETMIQKASYAQAQQQQAMSKAKNMLSQGKTCFEQKNYSCAIAKSESALEFVPGFDEAARLKQQAQQEIMKLKQSIKIE